jgi:protein-disulfide isomerase
VAVSTKDRHANHVSRRAERRLAAERAARRKRLLRIGGAIAAVAVIAAVVYAVSRGGEESDTFPAIAAAAVTLPDVPVEGRAIGNPDAPVMVVEYGDYQCPGCGYFAQTYERQLIEEYVATGKVRFEFRDYAFIGEESTRAAEAAFCALDQDAFWPYHRTLFANQHGENEGAFSASRLRSAAEQLGLDGERFSACLDDGTYADQVTAMRKEGVNLGIPGTPGFVVNGTLIEYRGFESLQAAIEAELA